MDLDGTGVFDRAGVELVKDPAGIEAEAMFVVAVLAVMGWVGVVAVVSIAVSICAGAAARAEQQ